MLSKKLMLVLGLLVVASMVLAACAPAAAPETVVETVVVTVEKEGETVVQVITPTPEPVALPDTLVICQGQEPETLYGLGGSMLAMSHVLEAIKDGPFDTRTFAYQPVILEKLPSLADGDAVINEVTVKEGDTVVDADANVITLDPAAEPKQKIKVAGSADAVEYTGGEVVMEQMVVTFKMLPNVMWEDGTPVKASDSVYGYNLVKDPDTPVTKFTPERTASYEATDDVTTVWTGLPGYKDSVYYTNFWTPYPEHVLGQYTALELLEAEESSLKPIGWGPYKIIEWTKGDNIRLEKMDMYFRAAEGLPKFQNLVYRFIGENANSGIAAVLAGECDILDQTVSLEEQAELLLEMQAAGEINATFVTGTVYEHLDFGIQHISYDDGYDTAADDRYDFFSDLKVRQGIAHCIDRQAVIDSALYGQSVAPNAYIPDQHPLFNANIQKYEFDVEKGKALLAEAGWADTNGDGTIDKDGVEFVVAYETTTATLRQQVTQIVAEQLKACGITANLQYYPSSEWFADGPDGKLFGRRFDLGEFAWLTGVEPSCDLYITDGVPGDPAGTWISIMRPETADAPLAFPFGWGGQNDTGFTNVEYDLACKSAIASLPGQASYTDNHLKAQELFANNLPVLPLYLRIKLSATRPDMCNFFQDPTANSEMFNIEEFAYGPLCDN